MGHGFRGIGSEGSTRMGVKVKRHLKPTVDRFEKVILVARHVWLLIMNIEKHSSQFLLYSGCGTSIFQQELFRFDCRIPTMSERSLQDYHLKMHYLLKAGNWNPALSHLFL